MKNPTLDDIMFAAGQYLSDCPTMEFWKEWHEGKAGTHAMLLEFIGANPWEPFQDYPAEQIWRFIRDLANSIAHYIQYRIPLPSAIKVD